MTWVKLDDKFHRNEKQLRMSDAAFRVYVCSLSYCGDTPQPTGFLSEKEARNLVRGMGKFHRTIEELVELRAWERVKDGYLIHHFEEYLPKTSTERVKRFRNERRNVWETTRNEPRARRVPVPAATTPDVVVTPVPVPDASKSTLEANALTPGVQMQRATESAPMSDEALELATFFAEVLERALAPLELGICEVYLQEFAYLGRKGIGDRIKAHVAWCQENGKPPPRTVHGFHKTLQGQNDYLADHGGTKADHQANGRISGLTHAFPAELAHEADP
jgi:hypothetical protein